MQQKKHHHQLARKKIGQNFVAYNKSKTDKNRIFSEISGFSYKDTQPRKDRKFEFFPLLLATVLSL